jgi:secernin
MMCDTWVALPDTTTTQNVIFAKNSDRPIFDCQPLVLNQRRDWEADSEIQLEYMRLPQVETTCTTLGSSPYWCWGYEEGINEYGVVIGNEAVYTKTFKQLASAYRAGEYVDCGLLGMDLIRLALERSQTAEQAIQVMGNLIEQYGQFGSGVPTRSHIAGGYDNSFIIADSSEAWVLEAVGKRWVAKRYTSGYTSISNELTIRQQWDASSSDMEQYARQQGWWNTNETFDFARAYIDEEKPRQTSHMRVMRSRQLLADHSGQIDDLWMKRIARDHYEDTFLQGAYFDAADPDFLSICMHVSPADFTWGNTASSCVAILPKSSDEISIFWWTSGSPCNGCYVPFFPHSTAIPKIVSTAGVFGDAVTPPPDAQQDTFSDDSYWWLFRRLLDCTKGDEIKSIPSLYTTRNQIVRERFDALEADFRTQLPTIVASATQNGDVDATILNQFSADCVDRVLVVIHGLLEDFGA